MRLFKLALVAAMVFATAASVRAATATWDRNTEPDLAGYILSYGTQSGVHTVVIDVGNVTTYQFNPPPGRYFVVVQAYNTTGAVSVKSNEVTVDIPTSGGGTPGGGTPGGGTPGGGGVAPPFSPPVSNLPPVTSPTLPPVPPTPPPPGFFQPAPSPTLPPPPATPLRLAQPSNQATQVNTGVVLPIVASHIENKPFTFSTKGLPPGLSIDSGTGVVSGTPHTLGFYRVTVTVSDGSSSASGDFTWSVVEANPVPARPNQPPILQQPMDFKTAVNEGVELAMFGSDPDGQALTFTASGLPGGLSIDRSSGVISGTASVLGLYTVTVTASDGELSTSVSFRWAVVQLSMLADTSGKSTSSATSAKTMEDRTTDYVDVSGDFDGDGRNDLATYRQSTSEWRIWTSSSNFEKPMGMVWGAAGDRPVAADYNGDGVTDFAVYRPSAGTWHISLSGSRTPLALHWGGPEDVPVALDHDGDGKADLALIRDGGYDILLSGANYLKSVQVR